jgi:hypothetical protein
MIAQIIAGRFRPGPFDGPAGGTLSSFCRLYTRSMLHEGPIAFPERLVLIFLRILVVGIPI